MNRFNDGFIMRLSGNNQINKDNSFKLLNLVSLIIFGAIIIAELTVDIKISLLASIILFAINAIILLLYMANVGKSIMMTLFVFLLYFAVESTFLLNNNSFHFMSYWFAYIPLCALLLNGTRGATIWIIIVFFTTLVNLQIAGQGMNSGYDTTISLIPFAIAAVIFCGGIFGFGLVIYRMLNDALENEKDQRKQISILQEETVQRNIKFRSYLQNINHLSLDKNLIEGNYEVFFEIICNEATDIMGISRVSIWRFNEADAIMYQVAVKDARPFKQQSITRLESENYIQSIVKQRIIRADDAREHDIFRDFKYSYLKPLGIRSLLDCAIVVDGEVIGVICCENEDRKSWTDEDVIYTQALSELIAISMKNSQINELIHEIQKQNQQLKTQFRELNMLNEKLNNLNQSLEQKVEERTRELQNQNEQLTEYAFINSHLLRAPLARILGLSNILVGEKIDPNLQNLLDALVKSCNELDEIITHIGKLLYEGNAISRKDLSNIINKNMDKLANPSDK